LKFYRSKSGLLSGHCQKYGGDEPLVVPIKGPQAQFPALITAENFPLFPFTDQFSTGIEINPANKISLAGDLNIPVPGWGNFDVDGNVYYGNINVDTKVGYQIRPTNRLNIKPETLALLGQSPEFRAARKKAKEVVGTSPYAYAHGHAFNPVSPFDLNSINDDDVTQVGNRPIRHSPAKKIDKDAFYRKFYDKLPQ
ncbi:hypothetical protein TELCIR_17554, partial [Teladorsagia circumcincta]